MQAVEPGSAAGSDKLGLALSGGGFRASLFHIGVLAQLADLGLLRRIEAISTVSGGSIVGALYYLYVRALLQEKSDEDIQDADYRDLVARMLEHFLRVVQTNLRMRTFQSFTKNVKMFQPSYSRSDHIGELFDQLLYRPVFDAGLGRMVEMREIKVAPLKHGEKQEGFKPKTGNAERLAKVPIILINATDLNSGHNWRFEASRMGEPGRSRAVEREVDRNLRLLRPPSYEDVVAQQRNIELGLAVGASAAVPGLFPPLALSGLYAGIRVELVDGGVHDNQGVQGLVDPDVGCTHYVVSDASGPLQDEDEPATGSLDVVSRSSDVQFDRIREEQMIALIEKHGPRVAYMHLRKGLATRQVPWIGRGATPAENEATETAASGSSTRFGIAEQVQDLLSRVRTDLDSFSDVEAYSLMLDGYNMSRPGLAALRDTLGPLAVPEEARAADPHPWAFLAIAPLAGGSPGAGYGRYLAHLKAAAHRFFKPFRLSTLALVAGVAALAGALYALYVWLREPIHALLDQPLWTLAIVLGVIALARFAPRLAKAFEALRILRKPVEIVARFVAMVVVAGSGALGVRIYLLTINRLFLWMGRLDRLK